MTDTASKRVFQQRFNQLLEQQRITQKDVAAICGVSTSTVSTWSKGINMPRLDKLERLAAHFALPRSYFIEEREPELDFDDFSYAMQNECRGLNESDRQILLSLARELNHARKNLDGKSR